MEPLLGQGWPPPKLATMKLRPWVALFCQNVPEIIELQAPAQIAEFTAGEEPIAIPNHGRCHISQS